MLRSALTCSAALVLLSTFTAPAQAEPRPMLAVLDFVSAGADVTDHELSLLSDLSRAEARRTLGSAYTIITQESIQQLLKAHGKTLEQCQGECETETGKLLGAELVVSGRVMKAFGRLKVNLKLHRTDPPELLDARVITVATLPELETAVTEATSRVLLALSDDATGAPASPGSDSGPSEDGSLKKSLKRAAKDVAKRVLNQVVQGSQDAESEPRGQAEGDEDLSPDEQGGDWRGETEWIGLYGALGRSTPGSGPATTGGGIVVELLKFRFPIMDSSYAFLALAGARLETADTTTPKNEFDAPAVADGADGTDGTGGTGGTDGTDGALASISLSGALMVGYGLDLGGPHGLELSVGYGSGTTERTTSSPETDTRGFRGGLTSLSYHYRIAPMVLRTGLMIQALKLDGDEGDTLQQTLFYLGAAY